MGSYRSRRTWVFVALISVLILVFPPAGAADFARGDVDANGQPEITDAILTLGFLFLGDPKELDCRDAADVDDTGVVDITDAVSLLTFLFLGGEGPLPPFPGCGPDPTGDDLNCASYPHCNLPPLASFTAAPLEGEAPLEVAFDASGSSDPDGAIASYIWEFGDGQNGSGVTATHIYLVPGTFTVTLTVKDDKNVSGIASKTIIVTGLPLPPDPWTVAPALSLSVATTLATATEFLYTGPNPIQSGVAPGTINHRLVGALHGRLLKRDGTPLAGVKITVLGRPEFGHTLSRLDGMFDLAVNGGSFLTLKYERSGYCQAQRQVHVPWQEHVRLPDVVMIPLDPAVTSVQLGQSAPMQVAQGSLETDGDGARQAMLILPSGTCADLVLPNGSTRSASTLNLRFTEFTVGTNGPQAMPADLPPTSAYTYCVELTADEALAMGATEVRFDRPLYFYLENFLNFPGGMAVPTGYYDRARGVWVASKNGQVVKVLAETGGLADLDLDGDGAVDDAAALAMLEVTDAERERLAALYEPGLSLWRVPVSHFSPLDCNESLGLPEDAERPKQREPRRKDDRPDEDCEGEGSIVGLRSQILGERVGIAGTTFSLNYRSDRVPGRRAAYSLEISLSGGSLPASLRRIELEIEVAGRQFTETFSPEPYLRYHFEWDGKDALGRTLQGAQPVEVHIGYAYFGVRMLPAELDFSFARFSGIRITGNTRREFILWQDWQGWFGPWDSRGQGLGGWTLNVHHAYDPNPRVLFLGDGRQRSSEALGRTVVTVAGTGSQGSSGDNGQATTARLWVPSAVALGPDGSLYIADTYNNRIRKVDPDGIITRFAGSGPAGFSGDGAPAIGASLNYPDGLALGPDSSVYIADRGNNRIRRVAPNGIISTVAGTGSQGSSGDNGPATQAQLFDPYGIAVGPDGTLSIADTYNNRIRQVGTDGIITTVAGKGPAGYSGDGGPASQATLKHPKGVTLGRDGSLYIADTGNDRIRRVGPEGIITTVAGGGLPGVSGFGCDGCPATEAKLFSPQEIAVGLDGSLYFTSDVRRIRRVAPDGIITTVAGGTALPGFGGDDGPATAAQFNFPEGMAIGPDSNLYIADSSNHRVRRVGLVLPWVGLDDIVIPDERGGQIYLFDKLGRHLRTFHALTGAVLYSFTYDASGRLSAVADVDGNVTAIERDASGNPAAIAAPGGQRTLLELNEEGYLARITNPAGESIAMSYGRGGLLADLTDPRGYVHRFSYDDPGRLIRDEDPAGGLSSLEREETEDGYRVALTTALGRRTTYLVEHLRTGERLWVNTFPEGGRIEIQIGTDGKRRITYQEGSVLTLERAPDPRWKMLAPVLKSTSLRNPGGLESRLITNRTVTLTDPLDPLSLASLTETRVLNGHTFTLSYAADTRKLTMRTPLGREATMTFSEKGRMVEYRFAGLLPVELVYDARGRLERLAQGTRAYSLGYDEDWNVVLIVDPLSSTTALDYDRAGRIVGATFPDARELHLDFDVSGNLTALTPPGRPAHMFTYTPVNLPSEYLPPDVNPDEDASRYSYNADREMSRLARPDGQTLEFEYGGAGCVCSRLSTLTSPRGSVTYAYHPATGLLTDVTAPGGARVSYLYDGFLARSETHAGAVAGSLGWTYDNSFRIVNTSINGVHDIPYQYNEDGILVLAGDLALTYDPQNDLLTGLALGNMTHSWTYNAYGEPLNEGATLSGSEIYTVQHSRDPLGRLTEKTETIGGSTDTYRYSYDRSGHLAEVSKNGAAVATYIYDSNSNRSSKTDPGGTVTGSYDDQDRLTRYGSTTYTYTANGELRMKTTNGLTATYEYDALGNLLCTILPDGTRIEYLVDGWSRRIGKKVNGLLVQGFLYQDGLKPIAELDGANNVVAVFVYGTLGNVPDYLVKGGHTYRIISDHLGSPRLVVDAATGVVAQRLDYDEFGNITNDTSPGFQPFGFAGGLYDRDTGLYRFGARDYDPQVGRWTAKDPLGFGGGDTNLYGYVQSDPVNLIDPSGLITWFQRNRALFRILLDLWRSWEGVDENSLPPRRDPQHEIERFNRANRAARARPPFRGCPPIQPPPPWIDQLFRRFTPRGGSGSSGTFPIIILFPDVINEMSREFAHPSDEV
ncbi:MAG: PKD domain-containing protein [Planctomycetes bacterium]|nr:PKD domain-containing protein [Planctomycetota bacterium]